MPDQIKREIQKLEATLAALEREHGWLPPPPEQELPDNEPHFRRSEAANTFAKNTRCLAQTKHWRRLRVLALTGRRFEWPGASRCIRNRVSMPGGARQNWPVGPKHGRGPGGYPTEVRSARRSSGAEQCCGVARRRISGGRTTSRRSKSGRHSLRCQWDSRQARTLTK